MFNYGDYVTHKEYPKSEVVFHLDNRMALSVINAQADNFKYATQEQIDEYCTSE